MAKWFAARTAVEVVDEALQLPGIYGYIALFYRAATVLEIYEGTKEVEKIIIARRVLGRY
jgi:acyl-CoA dehydrogenase